MAKFNPRNRNIRHDEAPLSWSQSFYDTRPAATPPQKCGFDIGEQKP